jgi:hypothetical protein
MAADDFIELVIVEGIGDDAKVVYDIGIRARVKVYADSALMLVASTTDIENFLSRAGGNPFGLYVRLTHKSEQ